MKAPVRLPACAASVLALATLAAATHGSYANASTVSPLRQAIANTDRALSYREDDTRHTVGVAASSTQTAWEIYDQRHNRERDHAHITLALPGGKTRTYSIDIVMLNNRTYYRSTLDRAGWKVRSGYGYVDAASANYWVRSPQNFSFLLRLPIASQQRAPDGTLHVRFRNHLNVKDQATEATDVWISTRGSPYITRYVDTESATVKGKRISLTTDTRLSGFNQPISISAPKLGT